jgi:cytochrome c oxidase cbb3-type subunit IV
MDINVLRSGVTVIGFVLFMGILVWAWRPDQKTQFDEAAKLPFQSD